MGRWAGWPAPRWHPCTGIRAQHHPCLIFKQKRISAMSFGSWAEPRQLPQAPPVPQFPQRLLQGAAGTTAASAPAEGKPSSSVDEDAPEQHLPAWAAGTDLTSVVSIRHRDIN